MANAGVPGRLWALRVAELKEVCRQGGLARSGNKPELQRRIVDVLTTTSFATEARAERIRALIDPSFSAPAAPVPMRGPSLADQLLASGQARQVVVRAPPLENAAPSTSAGRDRCAALDPFLPLVDGSVDVALVLPPRGYARLTVRLEPGWSARDHVVVLRSAIAGGSARGIEHRWPLGTQLSVNGTPVAVAQVPQLLDTVSGKFKDRHMDEPLAVPTSLLRTGINQVDLRASDSEPHVLLLALAAPTSVAQLRTSVERDRTLPLDECLARVVNHLGGGDDDFSVGSMRLSLQCTLSHARVTTPARATGCRHLECFDLESYLQCQRVARVPKWKCPTCSAAARPSELVVDSWLLGVLHDPALAGAAVADLQPDGTARPWTQTAGKRKAAAVLDADDSGGGGGASSGSSGGESSQASSAGSSSQATAAPPREGEEENPICLD